MKLAWVVRENMRELKERSNLWEMKTPNFPSQEGGNLIGRIYEKHIFALICINANVDWPNLHTDSEEKTQLPWKKKKKKKKHYPNSTKGKQNIVRCVFISFTKNHLVAYKKPEDGKGRPR